MAATDTNALSGPSGIYPKRVTIARIGLYVALTLAAIFFLAPLYVMIVTSLKSMDEIRQGNVIALPEAASLAARPAPGPRPAPACAARGSVPGSGIRSVS